jgi:predicted acyl esterase
MLDACSLQHGANERFLPEDSPMITLHSKMIAIKRMFDVRSTLRDGVELSSDIWLPGSESKHPLILIRTPYLKTLQPSQLEYSKLAKFFAENGYAVAVQDVRVPSARVREVAA